MNLKKTLLLGTLMTAMFGLTACQSTAPNTYADGHRHGKYPMQRDGDRGFKQRPQLTPEQRAEWQAKREQRLDQRAKIREEHEAQRAKIATACQGKRIGDRVNIQWNNRTIEGTCEVRFTPDQANFKRQA
ncbi:heavy-metal resistance [Acinetobacter sp. VNK23]|uniref:heavy-metal resistance n=1 Tax=Acinetobacter thutiue TaxID=2998078 RepID=UPI002578D642|nr:heavy-metal resistance [Acinetobacter thutiue]MDM1019916.1 heavy-metal resistance [Acinetobacter thutiue]